MSDLCMPESVFIVVGLDGQQHVQQDAHLGHIAAVVVDVDQVATQAGVHLRQPNWLQMRFLIRDLVR